MIGNIFTLLFLSSIAAMLILAGSPEEMGFYWVAIGIICFIIIALLNIRNNPDKSISEDATTTVQAFIICVLLGPIIILFFRGALIPLLIVGIRDLFIYLNNKENL